MKVYPLKFHPILMQKVWGGNTMCRMLNKESKQGNIGESWELSDVNGNISVISNGEYKGKNLRTLIAEYPEELLGKKEIKEFPILLKFLDANAPLSIQVHPNEKLAQEMENSHGKTEMWYVVNATEDAEIYLGWAKPIEKDELIEAYKAGNIKDYLKVYHPKQGEFFFVPAGSIHALGKGVVIAEIQQTSDVTYRIYDWGRTDRELHIEKAIAVTDYAFKDNFKLQYTTKENELNSVIQSDFFETYFLPLTERCRLNTEGTYDVLMCVEGEAEIHYNNTVTSIALGETVLIPATMEEYELVSKGSKLIKIKSFPNP